MRNSTPCPPNRGGMCSRSPAATTCTSSHRPTRAGAVTAETVTVCPLCGDPHREVDVYPVGWLSTLRRVGRALFTRRHVRGIRRMAWFDVRRQAALTLHRVRHGQWRELKNSFNGYLAEPHHWPDNWPDGKPRRCGSGWTQRRALRSLQRNGYAGPTTRLTVAPGEVPDLGGRWSSGFLKRINRPGRPL